MNTAEPENPSAFFLKFDFRKLIFYFVSIVFILVVYLRWGEVDDLREIFLKSHVSWFLVAIFLQALTYVFMALNYHYIFRMKGHTVSSWELYPMAFIVQFINQVFPSAGISGQIFLVDYLRMRGATIADGVGRSILEIASLFCGFGAMFIIAGVLYFASGAFHHHPNLIYLVYIFWVLAAVSLTVFLVIQRHRNQNWISKIINYFKNRSERKKKTNQEPSRIRSYWSVFVEELRTNMSTSALKTNASSFNLAIMWQGIVFFLDILTLYALTFALDIQISFALVFIIFTFTQFISMISFIPGSLVIYEGGMAILLIAYGVDRGSALTLALLFRALIFWLPMPIGWLLYRHYEKNLLKQELQEATERE